MVAFAWNEEKNTWLKKVRNISFEEAVIAIINNKILEIKENKKKYPNQKIYYVVMRNYVFMIPFVEENKTHFLKTIIPSRKATKAWVSVRSKIIL